MSLMIASAEALSSAAPPAFYARWLDHASWPEWDPDTAWVRLDGAPAVGTTGTLKPTSGPAVRFRIGALRPDAEYTDVSTLPGARLTFRHDAEATSEGTRLRAVVTLDGPLARAWALILGKDFRRSVPHALRTLVRLVEAQAQAQADAAREAA